MTTPFFSKGAASAPTASKKAAVFDALPAALLGDSVLAIPAGRGRTLTRLAVVLAVICTVIGLTVAKYVSDNSLRSSVYIERVTDVSSVTPSDAASGICPCQRQWIPWGEFVNIAEPAAALVQLNTSQYLAAQCRSLVDTGSPALINSTAVGSGNSSLFAQPYARDAAVRLCQQTLLVIVNSLRNITDTDTFTSPALQSVKGAERAYTIYAGDTVVSQLRAALLAYDALATAAQTVVAAADCGNSTTSQCNSSTIIRSLADADSVLAQEIAIGEAALNEVATTILLENEQATATDLLREMATSLGVVDWEAYKDRCNILYCDITVSKTTLTRVVEFLAVVGGLWQSTLFGGIMIWFAIGFVARFEDHTYIW